MYAWLNFSTSDDLAFFTKLRQYSGCVERCEWPFSTKMTLYTCYNKSTWCASRQQYTLCVYLPAGVTSPS